MIFLCFSTRKKQAGSFRGDQAKIKGPKITEACHRIKNKNMVDLVLHLNSQYYHSKHTLKFLSIKPDIFLKLIEDIPELFVHYFQMFTNFLYVCQSVNWLTSFLKLGRYRDISCSGWDILLKFFRDILGMFVYYFQIITNF